MHGSKRTECYPQTRVAVRDEITAWINGEDSGVERILWVSGPAGAGKTAIARSLVKSWRKMRLLAASFFFSSVSGMSYYHSKARLIPTLAYQLTRCGSLRFATS